MNPPTRGQATKQQTRRAPALALGLTTLLVSGLIMGFTGVMAGKPAGGAMKSSPLALGPIIFVSNRLGIISGTPNGNDIWTMNANGTNPVALTDNDWAEYEPQWNPGGTKIAFTSNREAVLQGLSFDANWDVYTMDPDGSGVTNLTNSPSYDFGSTWSPDGSQIAFATDRDGNMEIYVMDQFGGNLINLTNNSAREGHPAWSPDGSKIAFFSDRNGNDDIYSMNANGSGLKRLTKDSDGDVEPAWSPDGTKIVYYRGHDVENHEIYIMRADGKQQVRLTDNYPFLDADPTWKP